ncbi:MAG: hypothetical protein ABL951_04080 [Alphaproteobacteria bacterium]
MKLNEAFQIATRIQIALAPHCEFERCRIAGSIRRGKADVGDIEIVCLPKKEPEMTADMFPTATGKMVSTAQFHSIVQALVKTPDVGNPNGRNMRFEMHEGIKLDLFMPQAKDYFRIFAMRTGSADYSHKVIATAWVRMGYHGSENGLQKQEGLTTIAAPAWQSEHEFFEWLGLQWIDPKLR